MLNDRIQQSTDRAGCWEIMVGATIQELRDVCDLNYLDTSGNRRALMIRIANDLYPQD